MAASEPAARTDGDWSLPRLLHRFHRASLLAVRGSDHVYIVPGRRAHAHTQDAHTSAHRLQSHSRCATVTNLSPPPITLCYVIPCVTDGQYCFRRSFFSP